MMEPTGTLDSRAAPASPPGGVEPPPLHDLACVIHVHSTYSDGTATMEELIECSSECDRDVLLLTDHDTLAARHAGWEGWHGSVLVGVGVEISPPVGHFLAFGLDREIPHAEIDEAEIPAAVADAGGFGFAAHPFSRGSAMAARYRLANRVGGKPHGWTALDDERLAGIELWSLTTDAAEAWRSPRDAIRYLRHPERALDGPPPHHLSGWDRLCATRRVAAVGGLDAHQHGVRVGSRMLSPMSNARYFRLLSTYAQLSSAPTGDGELDLAAVYEALREGRSYLSVDAFGEGRGFRFWGEGPHGAAVMGSEHAAGEWRLRARAPRRGRMRLLRDGATVAASDSAALEHRASEPGVYRVEVHVSAGGRDRPWILSNPIYLR